jgi:hypothetical protein
VTGSTGSRGRTWAYSESDDSCAEQPLALLSFCLIGCPSQHRGDQVHSSAIATGHVAKTEPLRGRAFPAETKQRRGRLNGKTLGRQRLPKTSSATTHGVCLETVVPLLQSVCIMHIQDSAGTGYPTLIHPTGREARRDQRGLGDRQDRQDLGAALPGQG